MGNDGLAKWRCMSWEHMEERHVRQCLRNGATLEDKNLFGWTPLHKASFAGNPEAVLALLKYGANPTVANNAGVRPVHLAPKDSLVMDILDSTVIVNWEKVREIENMLSMSRQVSEV